MVGPSFPSVTMVRPNPPIWKNDEKIWKPRKNKGKLSPIWKNPGNTVLSLWGVAISISIYIYIYIYISIYTVYIYIYTECGFSQSNMSIESVAMGYITSNVMGKS